MVYVMANSERGRPEVLEAKQSNFGTWLKVARQRKGWSGEMLATAVETSQSMVSAYERGHRHPRRDKAVQIAQALGANPQDALNALMADTPGLDTESLTDRYGPMSAETIEAVRVLSLFPTEEQKVFVENLQRLADVRGLAAGKERELVS